MEKYEFKEEDIRQHLVMQQDIINRMANNSSNCKAWLITIIAALTTLQLSQEKIQDNGWLMLVVCFMFWYLDAFYLAIERLHRSNEEKFITELKRDRYAVENMIFKFSTQDTNKKLIPTLTAMCSMSCLPFYLIIMTLVSILIWGSM